MYLIGKSVKEKKNIYIYINTVYKNINIFIRNRFKSWKRRN